jgi:chromosomal replication initiator protein
MGQVLPLFPRLREQPRIIFGRALVHRLVDRASKLTAIPAEDIFGFDKTAETSMTRFAVMAVAKEAGKSFPQIGKLFGGRDHTSIIHACKRAIEFEAGDEDFAELISLLRQEARNG